MALPPSLTRIRNNQVYNSDIYADAKVVTKSISGGLLSDNFTYTGNMTIGNLTISGNTTTIDTTNLVIADPMFSINRNATGAPSYDLGIIMGRGSSTNVAFIWEENAQQFQLQYTTQSTSATTFGQINNSGYANLQVYGLAATNATIGTSTITNIVASNVAITGGTINNTTIGATTPNTGVFTSVTTSSGGQLSGYHTGAIGANTANTGAFTTISATGTITGAGQVIGYFNGIVGANAANSATFTTANVNGTLNAATINASTIGNTGATFSGASSTLTGTSQAASFTTSGGGQLVGYLNGAIGANTANSGAFTTVTATGSLTAQGTITGGGQVIGYLNGAIGANAPNTIVATSVTTSSGGQVTGYLTGAIGANTANTGNFTSITTTGSGGNITGTNTGYIISGYLVANNNSYANSYLWYNNNAPLATTITGTYSNSNVAAYLPTYNGAITASTLSLSSSANSYGAGQGALQITGGFYAGGDSYINGNLSIAGNLTSIGYNELIANAPLLYLSVGSISTYNYELGFYSHKYDAAVGYNHTGLVRNHLDNAWYLFSNIRTEPTATVDLANASIIYDTLKLGNVIAYSGNTSTSTTTGAAVIYGGMGVGGNIYAAAIQNTPIGNGTASTGAFTTLTTSSTITSQGTVAAPTLNAGTIGNAGATISGASMTLTGNISVNAVSAGQIGNTNTILEGTIASVSSSQPNITSLGTLNSLTVTGNASVGNLNSAGQVIGYLNGAIGANVPNSAVFTSLLTTTTGGNGNAYIAGNLIVTGNINAITANVYTQGGIFYGAAVTGMNALYAGQTGYTPLSNVVVQFSGNTNNYAQVNLENSNSGAQASGDIVVTADNGTDVDTYIDMGINSSGYVNAAYGLQKANDGYLYVAGNTTTGGGNLVISTTTANDIIFSLGGIAAANEFARMRANTNSFVISSTTASTNTGTGAMQVRGGVGISGDLNVGGNINGTTAKNVPTIYASNIYPYANVGNLNLYTQLNSNLTINANQIVANLVVHGNSAAGYQNLLVTNGATGQVGIKISPDQIVGNVSLQVNGTDAMIIPTGAQSARPSNPQQGMMRFNTNNNQLEFYTGTTWSGTGTSFTVITADQFVGDGSQTNFTLSQASTTNGTIISINGVIQLPTTAYTVSGTTLTFTEAPLNTDIIDARALVTTSSVTGITDSTGANTVVANSGGVYTSAINTPRYLANNSGNFFNGGISTLSANTSLSAGVPTIIDSFSTNTYRGAKYVVTLSDYTNWNFTMAEVVLVCGNSNASIQTYGVVSANGTSIGNFYANVSGTTARLYANAGVSSYAKVQQIYMPL